MEISEEKLAQIENDLVRFFRNMALPRFMRELRADANFDGHGDLEDVSKRFAMWLDESVPFGIVNGCGGVK